MRKGQFSSSFAPGSSVSWRCFHAFFLYLFFCLPIYGISHDILLTQLIREQWQTEKGLPQNSVHDIIQDRDGYLWLGTEGGLVRFDGSQFEVFDKEYFSGNFHNFVHRIMEAKDGAIWVGTRGNGVYELHRDKIKAHLSTEEGLSNDQVHALAQTSDGAIWIGTRRGLNRYFRGELRRFAVQDGLPSDFITALYADPAGILWVGTEGAGIASFDGQKFTIFNSELFQHRSDVKSIVPDGEGGLWVGLDGDGLFRFKDGKFTYKSVLTHVGVQNIQRLFLDRQKTLWVATQFDGIVRVKDDTIQTLRREEGLSENYVLSFLEDRENTLWIGTALGGLNRLREGPIRTFGAPEGLPGERVTCMAEAPDGGLYIGTYTEGLFGYFEGQFSKINLEGLNEYRRSIRALTVSRDGSLWVGTGDTGIIRIKDGAQEHYEKANGLLSDDITVLYEDSTGGIWIGTSHEGLSKMNPSTGTLVHYTEAPLKQFIRCLWEDSDGAILAGTQSGGLLRIFGGTVSELIPASLTGAIRSLAPAEKGGVWVATRDNGIALYKDGSYIFYNADHGLRQGQLVSAIEEKDSLWISSSLGIERVTVGPLPEATGKTREFAIQSFNEIDGMRTTQAAANGNPSALRTRDGRLWFATERGLCMIDPAAEVKSRPPEVLIKRVLVDGVPVEWENGLRLDAGVNRLNIQYTVPVTRVPSRVRFQFQLKGDDTEPVHVGFRREAIFHNLDPGDYTFVVRASDETGEWSNEVTSLPITQEAYFYQTPWFLAVLCLSGIGAIRTGIRWRTRSISQRTAQLEKLVSQRTAELTLEVEQRKAAQDNLRQLNEELEEHVSQRTAELKKAYRKLQLELAEREKAEAALSESESRLRRVVESGMVGILFWDAKGGVNQANDTFLQMIGYTRAEVDQGVLRWDKITPPKFHEQDQAALQEIARKGVCAPFEKEYLHKDGHRVPVVIGGASFAAASDQGVCFVLDISRRKEAEEKIKELNLRLETRVQERTAELAQTNERLAREVSARRHVAIALEAFSQLGKKLQQPRTEREAARIITETARDLIGWDACSLDIYGSGDHLIRIYEMPLEAHEQKTYGSNISVPIKYEEKVIGIIALKKEAPSAFTIADSSTLQSLSDYCSGALQRIHIEEARRESERRFTAFMNNTPAMAWLKDSHFRYIYGNHTFLRKLPGLHQSLEGKTDYDLWPERTASKLRSNDEQALALGRTFETHEVVPGQDGEMQTWLVFKFPFVAADGQRFVGGMAVDVTEQKRAEDALRKFPQKILEAQESERRRVARELHDSVQQVLSSIIFRVQNAELQMSAGNDRWADSLARTRQLLDSAMEEVNRIGRNLRPSELDDIGLVAAIESTLREFSERTRIEVKFDNHTYHGGLEKLIELTLYRIVQEALNNIEKHAGASEVTVTLECDETYVTLQIDDNGKGFVIPNQTGGRMGMGLMNMKERASSVGGFFSIKSSLGGGVHVSIHLPLAPPESKDYEYHQLKLASY